MGVGTRPEKDFLDRSLGLFFRPHRARGVKGRGVVPLDLRIRRILLPAWC